MRPRVSICLPNLNTLPFLGERFDTIFGQTLRDWEMFVYDSYSDDGGWELIRQRAAGDNRIRITQGPREGPYPAWNECLRQTTGEFVYIATSDDTMAPDCLEKMVAALDRHQDCDLAHCPFIAIDERGAPVAAPRWPECTPFGVGLEKLMDQPHGFQAHWQKNSNAAWAFDMLFLPRLPRDWEFVGLGGGLTTLNFIPLIGTMILGVVGGRVLRNDWLSWIKVKWFTVGGVICLVTGWGFGAIGICPVVKAVDRKSVV